MKKTEQLVQIPHSTMYLPRIEMTMNEIKRAFNGHVPLSVLKIYLINFNDAQSYYKNRKFPCTLTEVIPRFVTQHTDDAEVWNDIEKFSKGQTDLIDLSVKYGLYYKNIHRAFKACFPNQNVDELWKQHKKHIQKRTSLKIYGYKNSALNPNVKAKKDRTMKKRYGVTNIMQSQIGVKRLQKTMQERYNVKFAWDPNSKRVEEKFRQRVFNLLVTDDKWKKVLKQIAQHNDYSFSDHIFDEQCLDLHHRDFILQDKITNSVDKLLRYYRDTIGEPIRYPENVFFTLFANDRNKLFGRSWLRYYHQKNLIRVSDINQLGGQSKYETFIVQYLLSHHIHFEANKRTILDGLEIDFYFPEKKIGLEINPNSTHNSNQFAIDSRRVIYNDPNQIKSRMYHYHKYQLAKEKGITLIQWFGPDLTEPTLRQISLPRLLSMINGYDQKIYARKVTIERTLDNKQARHFLATYHSQGASNANEYWKFSYHDRILAIASFKIAHNQAELKRLCFKPGLQIVGGLSKLINHFFKVHPEIIKITSFSDNNLGSGNGYKKAGASFIGETGPSLRYISWSNPTDSYSWALAAPWSATNKNGILFKASNEKQFHNQTEIEKYIEIELPHRTDPHTGYDRIYTAGSKKWEFERRNFD